MVITLVFWFKFYLGRAQKKKIDVNTVPLHIRIIYEYNMSVYV